MSSSVVMPLTNRHTRSALSRVSPVSPASAGPVGAPGGPSPSPRYDPFGLTSFMCPPDGQRLLANDILLRNGYTRLYGGGCGQATSSCAAGRAIVIEPSAGSSGLH